MNKRCTNSSCRKTFSTLTYGGICPFCGKVYPQLIRQGNHIRNLPLCVDGEKITFDLDKIAYYRYTGQRVKGIQAIKKEFSRHGYTLNSVRYTYEFFRSFDDTRNRLDCWRTVTNPRTGVQEIEPVYHSIEHRFIAHLLNPKSGVKLLSACEEQRSGYYVQRYYGLTNTHLLIDERRSVDSIKLGDIKKVEVMDPPEFTRKYGHRNIRITVKRSRWDKEEIIRISGRSNEFNELVNRLLKLI